MSVPVPGSNVTALVSGASSTTQATAEANFNTALAAINHAPNTPVFVNFFSYNVSPQGSGVNSYTVAAMVSYIAPTT